MSKHKQRLTYKKMNKKFSMNIEIISNHPP